MSIFFVSFFPKCHQRMWNFEFAVFVSESLNLISTESLVMSVQRLRLSSGLAAKISLSTLCISLLPSAGCECGEASSSTKSEGRPRCSWSRNQRRSHHLSESPDTGPNAGWGRCRHARLFPGWVDVWSKCFLLRLVKWAVRLCRPEAVTWRQKRRRKLSRGQFLLHHHI